MAKRASSTPKEQEQDETDYYDVADTPVGELEQGLSIDEHALEVAWQRQPELFYQVAKKLALAISMRDLAKRHVAEIEAEVEIDIRDDASEEEKDGDRSKKITDKEVIALVAKNKKVQGAYDRLAERTLEVGTLTALRDAFSQRSSALKDLVKLHLMAYYDHMDSGSNGPSRKDVLERRATEAKRALHRMREEE
jgi:hypothetical protein